MSKAILVIDMPNNCKECGFFQKFMEDDGFGLSKGFRCFFGCSHIGCFIERPKDCPLKLFPDEVTVFMDDWADGYNACLEDILGDKQ